MGDTAVGVSVAVFGILSPDFGCSCEHHEICGQNIYLDMLVRFKSVIVEGGKSFFASTWFLGIFSNQSFLLKPFFSAGPRGYSSICGVYWVTEGTDRCLVGHVSDEFKPFFKRLEGRIAQVVDIFPCSDERKKQEYSKKRNGVCHVMLVDRLVEGDMAMMDVLDLVDEPSSDDDIDDKDEEDHDSVVNTTGNKKQKKS